MDFAQVYLFISFFYYYKKQLVVTHFWISPAGVCTTDLLHTIHTQSPEFRFCIGEFFDNLIFLIDSIQIRTLYWLFSLSFSFYLQGQVPLVVFMHQRTEEYAFLTGRRKWLVWVLNLIVRKQWDCLNFAIVIISFYSWL